MIINRKVTKLLSILMCLVILCVSTFSILVQAAPTNFEVYFNSGVVSNGGSIHYTATPVTIGIKVQGATDFYVTFGGSGSTGTVALISDGGDYNEYSLSNPSGAVIFSVVADGVTLPIQTINFYKDTVIDPGAVLSYVSVKAKINKVGMDSISPFEVDYDGYNNTGVNKQQVSSALKPLGYNKSGSYQLSGELQVAVFVNGTLDGYYWTSSGTLYTKYNWGSVEAELRQRADWGSTEYIEIIESTPTPTPTPIPTPTPSITPSTSPTITPKPTTTPAPTATPVPTPTPNPTPTPKPVELINLSGPYEGETGVFYSFFLWSTNIDAIPFQETTWVAENATKVRDPENGTVSNSNTLTSKGAMADYMWDTPGTYAVLGNALTKQGFRGQPSNSHYITIKEARSRTGLSLPAKFYPHEVTDAGASKNTITWSYSHPTNKAYVNSDVSIYKYVSGAWQLVLNQEQVDRSIDVIGRAGEQFKIVVTVKDEKGLISDPDEKLYTIMMPTPNLTVTAEERNYRNENINVTVQNNNSADPILDSYYPTTYTDWKVTDNTGAIVVSGSGKVPAQLFTDKLLYREKENYTVTQNAVCYGNLDNSSDSFYIVSMPPPDITLDNLETYINKTINTGINISQPQSPERGSLPIYSPIFDSSNSYYKIIDPDGNVLINNTAGVIHSIDVTRAAGFIDSLDNDRFYKIVQYAENDKNDAGKGTIKTVNLVIKKTPVPLVYLAAPNTYIDETINVSVSVNDVLSGANESTSIETLKTMYTNLNARWMCEELDSLGNAINIVEYGTGLVTSLDVFAPAYKEGADYKITQYVTNELGIEGSGYTDITVFTINPPVVTIKINERDSDPSTIKNEIYPKESLSIASDVTDSVFTVTDTWWEITDLSSNAVVKNGTGKINGLVVMDLPIGDYSITQYGKNLKNKVGQASISFKVKEVLVPVVDFTVSPTLDKIDFSNNIVYLNETLKFTGYVQDLNRSEEHPNGFSLLSTWAVKDTTENVVGSLKYNEVPTNRNVILYRGTFVQGQEYIFRIYTQNSEFADKNGQKDVHFTVGNKKPVITISTSVLSNKYVIK